jgi:hypothetical protein
MGPFLSAYAEDHACVPKHLHKAFRQRQALRRAGTGFARGAPFPLAFLTVEW